MEYPPPFAKTRGGEGWACQREMKNVVVVEPAPDLVQQPALHQLSQLLEEREPGSQVEFKGGYL